ncbi:MAG: phosphoenolpyruvate--protein phosphotransferase [Gemmatimonadales bacterium]|nr:phosphoenolpyruvate--protein phosphotransferase [Gemmatimonadales bacterium]
MKTFQGIAASSGYAVGPVHKIRLKTIVPARRSIRPTDISTEKSRFGQAVAIARDEIQDLIKQLERDLGPEEAGILSSQLFILEDEMVWDATLAVIQLDRINAEAAFAKTVGDVAARFLEIEEETFRERVNDLRDVEQRVLRAFLGDIPAESILPKVPSIIVSRNLTPSDTAALGRDLVLGFVMDEGGNTSHVAILARSLGVPALVGLKDASPALENGIEVAVDGIAGILTVQPDEQTRGRFSMLQCQQVVINEKLAGLKDLEAITPDGHRVRMMANIELPIEVDEALARGAEGIGLLRTEYIFFQHQTIPSLDDQVRIYSEMVRRMAGRPVIFRTLDVGGDKVSDYLGAKREYNPFLGWRGIRFSLANRVLFKTQIKAIYQAATVGSAKLMFPMISGVQELREAREVCQEAVAELERDGIPHTPSLEIGIMVETPSAVLVADLLARECDFFSIGSNDLIQYTLAMDRGNSRVSYLYQPLHPAILRSIKDTVLAAHEAGIWVGLCGEMGSETRLAEVLLGLELDEISLHGAALPKVKQVIRWTKLAEARRIVDHLLSVSTAEEGNRWLADYINHRKRERGEGEEL